MADLRRGCGSTGLYEALAHEARGLGAIADPVDRLDPLCELLWRALAPRGVSWIGFYLRAKADSGEEMVLAARRDRPACSPIGLHGACGQSLVGECVRLIEDVALLGGDYIACDPRDLSEIVVPIYRNGVVWGVLDADSHERACFGEPDCIGLVAVLIAAGLLDREPTVVADLLPST